MNIVTSEYIFIKPIKKEINNIINNTILEHNKKYGDNYYRKIEFKYDIQFFDKIKNKTKNITTKNIKKLIIASQGRYELIKTNKLSILIEGRIYKNVINTYMKCDNIPFLWRKFFLNIANNRDYVNKYCKRPFD